MPRSFARIGQKDIGPSEVTRLRRVTEPSEDEVQTIPEIGQLAIIRKRPFVVTEIIPSSAGLSGEATKAHHLIKLASVEDDGLGEELQVIWELEPGTTVHEKSTLPEPASFDHPKRLQAFLEVLSQTVLGGDLGV